MFHVLLALPALTALGAAAGLVLAVIFAVLGLAFLGGFLLKLVFRGLRWLLALPVLLGVVLSAGIFLAAPAAISLVLLFWVLYGAAMLVGWLLASVVKLLFFWIRGL